METQLGLYTLGFADGSVISEDWDIKSVRLKVLKKNTIACCLHHQEDDGGGKHL
jgi:hypothetical protein